MQETEEIFRALSDPTRRALFERLSLDGDVNVRDLTDGAGVSQPVVSKHLLVLSKAGLVEGERAGRQTRYRVKPNGLQPLKDWTARMEGFWAARFDDLEDLLNRMDQ